MLNTGSTNKEGQLIGCKYSWTGPHPRPIPHPYPIPRPGKPITPFPVPPHVPGPDGTGDESDPWSVYEKSGSSVEQQKDEYKAAKENHIQLINYGGSAIYGGPLLAKKGGGGSSSGSGNSGSGGSGSGNSGSGSGNGAGNTVQVGGCSCTSITVNTGGSSQSGK